VKCVIYNSDILEVCKQGAEIQLLLWRCLLLFLVAPS
jgi:hypothetical protein